MDLAEFPQLQPADELFVALIARAYSGLHAARLAYGVKGDIDQMREFVAAKMENLQIVHGLEIARSALKDDKCVSRAEKRWKLSYLIRESNDPDVVVRAISVDNRMTGDEELVVSAKTVSVYVVQAGDVIEVSDVYDCV